MYIVYFMQVKHAMASSATAPRGWEANQTQPTQLKHRCWASGADCSSLRYLCKAGPDVGPAAHSNGLFPPATASGDFIRVEMSKHIKRYGEDNGRFIYETSTNYN